MTTHQMNALSALPEQPMPFRERAERAIQAHKTDGDGADLAAYLGLHHDYEIAEVSKQAVDARNAAVTTAAAASIDQQLLSHVLEIMRPVLRTSGENAARAQHCASMVEAVRTLLREAEAGGVPAVDADALRRVLAVPAMPAPFRPATIGFVPSMAHTLGHFRHATTGAQWHLPFSGYMACEETPDRPMTVHLAFLHRGVVRARPQLYAEYGMVMEHLE